MNHILSRVYNKFNLNPAYRGHDPLLLYLPITHSNIRRAYRRNNLPSLLVRLSSSFQVRGRNERLFFFVLFRFLFLVPILFLCSSYEKNL